MGWKLELVGIPVSEVNRAKTFYADKVGFTMDHDHGVSDAFTSFWALGKPSWKARG